MNRRLAFLGRAAAFLAVTACLATAVTAPWAAPAQAQDAGKPGGGQAADQKADIKRAENGIAITPPPGHCFLDPAQAGDARLIGLLKGVMQGIRMLAGYAQCDQLKDWRAGKRGTLDDHGQYVLPVQLLTFSYQGDAAPHVKKFCAEFRKMSDQTVEQVSRTVKERLEGAIAGVKVNEQKMLGVLAEDDHACYFGILQKMLTETGAPKTQIGVTAYIVTGGKIVGSNLYTVYKGEASLTALLERQKENAMTLTRINGGR